MAAIDFDSRMHVGIETIDSQHEKLTAMINELYQAYAEGRDKEILSGIITGMADYTSYHFATEEELMQRHGYPDAASHQARHREFLEKSVDFLIGCVEEREELSTEVLDFLTDWWMDHINGTDKQLGAFLREQGEG